MLFYYRCSDCGREFSPAKIYYTCPDCEGATPPGEFPRGILETILEPSTLARLGKRRRIKVADWLEYPLPDGGRAYSVGNSPLIVPWRLRQQLGFPNLYLKNDGLNPSGSLKDRASQLVAAQAFHFKQKRVVLASTGNAGSAMACAGAALGLKVLLFVPATAPKAKLWQALLYGATVIPVRGTYDQAFRLSIQYTHEFGGLNRNTAYNPLTIEGKKSVALELYNQMGGMVPDVIFVPVGDGVIYAGVYKGFADLKAAGLIDHLPRIVAVQAEGSNAIAQAFRTGKMQAVARATTGADSIAVANPANGRLVVRYLHACRGWCVEVSEEAIATAQRQLAAGAGVFVEPAAAAAWAGFLSERERLDPRQNIVILLTGLGFKDLGAVEKLVAMPEAIEPDLDAIIKRRPDIIDEE